VSNIYDTFSGRLPEYSTTQYGKKDSFGVRFHLKEIVGSYLEQHWSLDSTKHSVKSHDLHWSVEESKVAQLMELGFPRSACVKVLNENKGDLQISIERLLSGNTLT
jgi:hypothetical protein